MMGDEQVIAGDAAWEEHETQQDTRSDHVSVDDIIRYENGEMSQDEIITMFQKLVNSGLAWKLQGHYGHAAMDLILSGDVVQR